ncbi:MAG: DNA repair protein RadA [Bacteroidales bacterium]|nr:MAG: DNA repair protein RadA [Bacteroidales bacterium]
MAKSKTIFICQNCGVESAKWIGKCPSCNQWNTYVEEIVRRRDLKTSPVYKIRTETSPVNLIDVSVSREKRIDLKNNELNRILGGGLVAGSLLLIGGEPGIGKSTLVLQVVLGQDQLKTLYISGEESNHQIKLRAERIGKESDSCYILNETSLEAIFTHITNLDPGLIVIDSIQTIHTDAIESSPGSVSQVRECSVQLLRYAKESNVPVILIGHITKEGSLAGPKALEHIVDTVLQFEGDQNHMYRILRAIKNRFGTTAELAIFEMSSYGLREVINPSELLISQHEENLSGIAISATIDGIRPFLIETQALVSSAVYGTPQRSSTGFDLRRLNMLLAVLEKRAGFRLGSKDVFLNIAGGIKIADPAMDLGIVTAILSSNLDLPVGKDKCFAAEVGLSGEIRPVSRIDQRILEAEKRGFSQIYISKYNRKGLNRSKIKNIDLVLVDKVEQVVRKVFS